VALAVKQNVAPAGVRLFRAATAVAEAAGLADAVEEPGWARRGRGAFADKSRRDQRRRVRDRDAGLEDHGAGRIAAGGRKRKLSAERSDTFERSSSGLQDLDLDVRVREGGGRAVLDQM
jgi:hypothetical protein